jgi:hypothetical protein
MTWRPALPVDAKPLWRCVDPDIISAFRQKSEGVSDTAPSTRPKQWQGSQQRQALYERIMALPPRSHKRIQLEARQAAMVNSILEAGK